MLSSSHRLTSPAHFREVVRRGRRSGGPLLVVHLLVPSSDRAQQASAAVLGLEPRAGFVVSKAVGPAVTRNLVKRRLRHLVRARLGVLPPASLLVVRALPASATATYAELGHELDRCLAAVQSGGSERPARNDARVRASL